MEGGDPLEIVEFGDLARRVRRDRERQFLRRDPAAVVGHLDAVDPPAVDRHRDPRTARVKGVLEQFLDDARGPLNDLASGDLIDEQRGKSADRHGSMLRGAARSSPTMDRRRGASWSAHAVDPGGPDRPTTPQRMAKADRSAGPFGTVAVGERSLVGVGATSRGRTGPRSGLARALIVRSVSRSPGAIERPVAHAQS
jgi:hypothetical protein